MPESVLCAVDTDCTSLTSMYGYEHSKVAYDIQWWNIHILLTCSDLKAFLAKYVPTKVSSIARLVPQVARR